MAALAAVLQLPRQSGSCLARRAVTHQRWRVPPPNTLAGHANVSRRGLVAGLEPPSYVKVPIVQEDSDAVIADMPELLLAGRAEGSGKASSSKYLGAPLDKPLAVEESQSSSTLGVSAPVARFAKLDNGVRIAAVDRQGLCSSLGLFVHAGSRYESAETASIPHMLELMAFRSSAHLSHLRTLKTLEQLGAAASCRVGREDILYQMDVLREYVPVALPLMLANVTCPSVLPEEIAEAQQHVLEVQQNLEDVPESLVCELLHVAAYQGNTLGLPLYADEKDLPVFNADTINNFLKSKCTPDKLILVGVNVDFDELCKWTARSFADVSPAGQTPAAKAVETGTSFEPAVYTGGEIRVERPNPLCHLMLGWEVEGGWNGPSLAAITVLQMFLGGGGSFSTGGPGKGMHTRLYTEVLNRHYWVESCQASTVMYADSGLFTIYATVVPHHADEFITVLARIFQGVTKISEVELQRAKNALKSSIHMNLETRAVMMEDIGRQLVLSGKVGNAQQFGKMVDDVTHQDLIDTLRQCLRTEVSVVSYGAIEKAASQEAVKRRFASVLQPPQQ
eukprot:TRINITY_DN7135_c4_g1_i1.p1 TRINITY_DN7135_c4_g1~~TRINITY_DN7135_c4_g1_i1.p1  ORF type:complete len:563 (+),score=111.14 TRINITY_DN7135_c4_g1_i1:57-1745(+)